MERLTKRTPNGIAYMAVADTLPKNEQEIEGSKPILEGLYAMFQKFAEYEDTGLSPEDIEKIKKQRDIYKENWIKQLNAILSEFDKDGWCRLVMKKEDVLQMKKEMETDYGIFNE